MRPRVALISALAWALGACADITPPRLDYAPPSTQPARPGAGYVGRPSADLIWDQLLDRLNQSDLEVDLADRQRGVIVATYSGDAAPYVDCGWILRYGEDEPERIDATSRASFDRAVQGRSVEVDRDLKLDARLAVEVTRGGGEAFVEATGNYVLTKSVVAEDRSGRQRGRAHEVVSFSTGERGAFSKGTVCQPNGALEQTVLDILPPATQVAQQAERTRPVAMRRSTIVETEIASDELPDQPAASPDPERSAASNLGPQALLSDDLERPAASREVPERSSECATADKVFCAALEITDPYRRANEEQGLGLEVERIEAGNPLLEGGDLGLDISLPNYEAYLTVSYFLRDGTVHHVWSGPSRRWPANAREFVGDAGLGADQSGNVEMVVAVASDVPLFESPRPPAESAESYLADLRRRLAETSGSSDPAQIAASLLVITPSPPQPS
jgi:hypothetical protein